MISTVDTFSALRIFFHSKYRSFHDDDIAIVFQIEGITTNANGMVYDLMVLI